MPARSLSVVIPALDERHNIAPLLDALSTVVTRVSDLAEIIVVDDGSSDGTWEELERYVRAHPDRAIRGVRHRRNFGQTAALATGLRLALGGTVVTLDADLQNDPADIPLLMDALGPEVDVVCGWRRERRDALVRLVPSRLAAGVIRWLTGLAIHDSGCTLRVYRREIARDLDLWGDMHRFIPALCHAIGARVAEVPVSHRARHSGATKYGRTGLRRLFRVALDLVTLSLLTRYRGKPIRPFGWWALFAAGGACAAGLVELAAGEGAGIALGLVLALLVGSMALLAVGATCELAARAYLHSTGQTPGYVRAEARSQAWAREWSGDSPEEGPGPR
jgi:glycosyltransferase involved in cell wall biosynthesis